MKRIVFISSIMILTMLLCACSSAHTKESSNSELLSSNRESTTPDFKTKEILFPDNFAIEEINLSKVVDNQINDATFAPDGSIYVSFRRSIAIYDKQQRLIKTIKQSNGEIIHTIASDESGNLYAGGSISGVDNFIKVYSPDGKLLNTYKNLFETQHLAIIRQITIDHSGNIYILIKYGSIDRWSIAILNTKGQLIKELSAGKVTPRSILIDESGNFLAGCWYVNKPYPDEPRLYIFSDIDDMKYTLLDDYPDYNDIPIEGSSVIDKNGILYSRNIAYYDNFNKSFEINIFNSDFNFSYHNFSGWTTDNNGNAVFWAGRIMASSEPSESVEYNCNLYRVKLI